MLPVVERIAPKLSVLAEIIRRNTCHIFASQVAVKLKLRGRSPYIGTVCRHINGQIADYFYPEGIDIFFHLVPLREEKILHKYPEARALAEKRTVFCHGIALAASDIVIPLCPRLAAEMLRKRHEKRIIGKPRGVFLIKAENFPHETPSAALICRLKQGIAGSVQRAVIHLFACRFCCLCFRFCKKPL